MLPFILANSSPEQVANKTLENAHLFYQIQRQESEISRTYGYFTGNLGLASPLNKILQRINYTRLQHILNFIDLTSNGRALKVVDLCCGGGLITAAIAAMGHSIIGFDANEREIQLAKIFARDQNLQHCYFESVDLLGQMAWQRAAESVLEGKPDIIVLSYALHHLTKPDQLIRRLQAWLEPGSKLIVNEEDPNSVLFQIKHRIRKWIQKDTDIEWHRSFRQWKSLFESSGFTIEKFPLQKVQNFWSFHFIVVRN